MISAPVKAVIAFQEGERERGGKKKDNVSLWRTRAYAAARLSTLLDVE